MSMLGVFKTEMDRIGVPYEFMRWTSTVEGDYWVGEYTETPTDNEDGYKESTLLVTGTTSGTWLDLENNRKKMESHFHPICGLRIPTDEGAVAFYYDYAFPVDTGQADLKRIQVNIKVKEWKGAI